MRKPLLLCLALAVASSSASNGQPTEGLPHVLTLLLPLLPLLVPFLFFMVLTVLIFPFPLGSPTRGFFANFSSLTVGHSLNGALLGVPVAFVLKLIWGRPFVLLWSAFVACFVVWKLGLDLLVTLRLWRSAPGFDIGTAAEAARHRRLR